MRNWVRDTLEDYLAVGIYSLYVVNGLYETTALRKMLLTISINFWGIKELKKILLEIDQDLKIFWMQAGLFVFFCLRLPAVSI